LSAWYVSQLDEQPFIQAALMMRILNVVALRTMVAVELKAALSKVEMQKHGK
jgi:hypothetical protein